MGAQTDLRLGDCLDVMRDLPAESVDAIVTDPPYGLAFMGKAWDHAVPGPEFFAEMLRVAKPGAHLFAFGGSRLYHRMTCAIEDAGWQVRDCLSWLYGSGFPKSHDIGKRQPAFTGYGTALKPAWEPIVLAMRPTDGTFAQNAERHGVAGLNVDAGRLGEESAYQQNRVTQGLSGFPSSFEVRSESTVFSPHDAGRWPANVVLDEAAGAVLDETVGELKSGDAPKRRNADRFARETYGDFKGQAECPPGRSANKGGPSRFFLLREGEP